MIYLYSTSRKLKIIFNDALNQLIYMFRKQLLNSTLITLSVLQAFYMLKYLLTILVDVSQTL